MNVSYNNAHGEIPAVALSPAEETLRLIAGLPAPEGLVERVQSGLHAGSATKLSTGRVLRWPAVRSGWMHSTAVRGAAAAAIVCVVVGGGWRIYLRVAPAPTAKVVVMPARVGSAGGFSSANAIHTPDTLKGPVLTHAVPPGAQSQKPTDGKKAGPAKKAHPNTAAPTVH